ncbi:MAG: type II toxin-antitoxin system HicB family antitoxin [Pseudomarimonas sp.]
MNFKHYTYRVVWSAEDAEFVGLCAEFPSLSWLDTSMEAALAGVAGLVEGVVADMQANAESVPEPISARQFSGKFQIRTTPERHRALATQAAEAGVSINRWVNDRLAG